MNQLNQDLLEKIRQQFDFAPYPNEPLDASPKDHFDVLYKHSLITPYYMRSKRTVKTEGKIILDVGCGSGYTSLILAMANPGAKIVGIDISQSSVDLAQKRLQYHGFEDADFHLLPLNDLPSLNLKFDYINCDEVLYLAPDIAEALSILKSVLNIDGIIRANLHSFYQRFDRYRAQQLFNLMGLMENNPEQLEIEIAIETMKALKDNVNLKARVWGQAFEGQDSQQTILMNYLFQGDKGYTIPELFSALAQANLEFISMVNWRRWELLDLFKDPENLPAFWEMGLSQASIEEQLHTFELLHPIHRLLDFWCGHPNSGTDFSVSGWTEENWQQAKVTLHPQLQSEVIKTELVKCIRTQKPFEISRYIPSVTKVPILIESSIAACLLPLWETEQTVKSLVERWRQIQPLDAASLQPKSSEAAWQEVTDLLSKLETFIYVLLEQG